MQKVTYSLFTRRKQNYRENKRKYNIRDCQCTLFSSSTEVSSLTLPNKKHHLAEGLDLKEPIKVPLS